MSIVPDVLKLKIFVPLEVKSSAITFILLEEVVTVVSAFLPRFISPVVWIFIPFALVFKVISPLFASKLSTPGALKGEYPRLIPFAVPSVVQFIPPPFVACTVVVPSTQVP